MSWPQSRFPPGRGGEGSSNLPGTSLYFRFLDVQLVKFDVASQFSQFF